MYVRMYVCVYIYIWCRVACRYTPHPQPATPMVYTRNPRFKRKVPTVTGMGPPEPGILVSVVTFEALGPRGVSKVATLTWMGHGFGLRRGPAADPQL